MRYLQKWTCFLTSISFSTWYRCMHKCFRYQSVPELLHTLDELKHHNRILTKYASRLKMKIEKAVDPELVCLDDEVPSLSLATKELFNWILTNPLTKKNLFTFQSKQVSHQVHI